MGLAPKCHHHRCSSGTGGAGLLKVVAYFLLENPRNVLVRPYFTCHVPISLTRQSHQNRFQGDYLLPGTTPTLNTLSVQVVMQDPFPGVRILHH